MALLSVENFGKRFYIHHLGREIAAFSGVDFRLRAGEFCLVSGPNRVDLARLAAVTGEADIRRSTAREAQELTGFVIGGIPPFGHTRPVRTIMDPDLTRFPTVWAAAGLPTAVFPVPPGTLRILANATVAPISEERRAADIEAEAQSQTLVGSGGASASNAGA